MTQAKYKTALVNLVLVGIYLAVVDYFFDLHLLISELLTLPADVLSVAVAGMMASYLFRAIRTNYLFSIGSLPAATGVTLIHNAWNIWLPGRVGEASFPLMMKHYFGKTISSAAYGLVWIRLMDLHGLLGIGLLIFLPSLEFYWSLVLVAAWLLSLPLLYLLLKRYRTRIESSHKSGKLGKILLSALSGVNISPLRLVNTWLLSAINWAVKISVLALIAIALAPLGYPSAIFAVIAGELTSVLPMHTPGGLGTYEAGMAFGLKLFDIELVEGFRAAVQTHAFLLLLGLSSGLLAYLFMKRRPV